MLNTYFWVILGFLVISYSLETLADILNLNALTPILPREFEGTYDPEKYQKAIFYQKDSIRFELTQHTCLFLFGLAFFLFGGFDAVDQFARKLGWNEMATGCLFIAILSTLKLILQLPFSVFHTFVLEQKFGFNRTTSGIFIADLVKGIFLSAVLGLPIFCAILYFFQKLGSVGWIYAWVATTVFQICLTFLAPAVIMPLFNRFTPLPEGALRTAIEKYAESRNFRLSGIFTMDSSKRSTKANAFFTGFGKYRRLVFFDTLLKNQTEEELVAILAHEIGHFERKHIQKSMLLSILVSGSIFYTLGIFLNNLGLFGAFQMQHTSIYASLIFVGYLASPALKIFSLFTQKLSRKFEFEADAFAVRTYGRPQVLIRALKKLSIDNLSNLTPHPLKVALDYTHPPILKRIEALRAMSHETK